MPAMNDMTDLLPLFVNLSGRTVVLVGGGSVAAAKLRQLLASGARVRVISPAIVDEIAREPRVSIRRGEFTPADLDGAWLVVAAATPEVNRAVAEAAHERRVFVNAVDDPANATAFLSGVVRRDGVTVAVSTSGDAPALTSLIREALDTVLPADLDRWMETARSERTAWRRDGVPMSARKPKLLRALNALYARGSQQERMSVTPRRELSGAEGSPRATELACGAEPHVDERMSVTPRTARPRRERSGAEGTLRATEPGCGAEPHVGNVCLVGAGPGDPGLLTRTAIARLRSADLVLYDALIDPRILKYARKAQKFFVGKRANRHAMSQHAIHALMIRAARRGRRVVRLKGGDPFVFGRGGEEALALDAAGIPYDVVPGVTSAVAAPAAAGIPVTHRGLASAFVVVAGHDEAAFRSATAGLAPNRVTVVVLMGVGRSAAIASALVTQGWRSSTPVAIVFGATTGSQHVWRGTLGDLAADRVEIGSTAAGTIVVGDVVALRLASTAASTAPAGAEFARPASRTEQGNQHISGR